MMKRLALALLACCSASQALACFTVYDRDNRVLYNAQLPPVDMSQPLHQTLPASFPGGHMVFDTSIDCPRENQPMPRARLASTNGRSPLLTEANTARSMGLPHTVVAGGIALVPERPDSMRPGVALAESGLRSPDDTRMMGAGPARPATSAMGAGPAQRPAQRVPNQPDWPVQPSAGAVAPSR